jgi:hypothetical protein
MKVRPKLIGGRIKGAEVVKKSGFLEPAGIFSNNYWADDQRWVDSQREK